MSEASDTVKAILSRLPTGTYVQTYSVSVVSAGASRDGVAQVSIPIGSSNLPVPYLASYTSPTVNDLVAVIFTQGSPLILGRVVGLPNF